MMICFFKQLLRCRYFEGALILLTSLQRCRWPAYQTTREMPAYWRRRDCIALLSIAAAISRLHGVEAMPLATSRAALRMYAPHLVKCHVTARLSLLDYGCMLRDAPALTRGCSRFRFTFTLRHTRYRMLPFCHILPMIRARLMVKAGRACRDWPRFGWLCTMRDAADWVIYRQ